MAHLESFVISFNSYVNEATECDEYGGRPRPRPTPSLTQSLCPRKTVLGIKLPLKYDFCVYQKVLVNAGSPQSIEQIFQKLVLESQNWPLHIQKCSLSRNLVLMNLDRSYAFKQVLAATSLKGADYGKHPHNNQAVIISSDMRYHEDEADLTQLRIYLIKRACSNLLSLMGYNVTENETDSVVQPIKLFVTQKSIELPVGYQRLLCGAVLNSKHKSKENQTKACEYYALRLEDMKTLFNHKFGGDVQFSNSKEILSSLQDAEVKIDFLCTKPSHTLSVNLDGTCLRSRVANTKGASFVMYNYARIAGLRNKFDAQVTEGYYPPLVDVEAVDFSFLSSEEEWELFKFVLKFPTILEESTSGLLNGNIKPNLLCSFVSSMCSCFSVYYSRIKILTEPRTQLLPVMFARLHLLHGIQQVLGNALQVFDIVPVSQM